ncbi:Beta and gamma crystallin [Beijerinckiaceae bacterium RH AL1]|nr:CVNH domain-containing protein [Beijerinckiaceae bacterium]VVB46732.1 Beta and gamma crystallin [Beijerinckiaceae bacterium RH CH11]VVB46815.1 Beta and gamma crystallin [Beijerinckiaceae bacterium RH AL8]VVC55529.1 Beta and gamma crystallin [Beijerinckiaceae bacterium RH AL1]
MTTRMTFRFVTALLLGTIGIVAARQPASAYGSFAKTCTNIQVYGGHIEALCQRVDGSLHHTRIFAPRCYGIHVSNQNGHLSCGG